MHSQEHPLKQSLGAFLGSAIAYFITTLGFWINFESGLLLGSFVSVAIATAVSAKFIGNRITPAIIWNVGIAIMSLGFTFFLYQYFEGL